MASNNTGFWHGWPLAVRIIFIAIIIIAVLFLVIENNRDIDIGPTGFKSTRSETTIEKNCRIADQQLSSWNQNISSEILALEAQVAIKDHDFSETRQKCLSAPANIPRSKFDSSGCHTEVTVSDRLVTSFANPRNDYETELNSIAQERNALQSRITAQKLQREQRQQWFDQQCLGAKDHAP